MDPEALERATQRVGVGVGGGAYLAKITLLIN